MTKKLFAIHGTAKGKKEFDHAPVAQVWANDEDDAKRQGELVVRSNPLHAVHFADAIEAREHNI